MSGAMRSLLRVLGGAAVLTAVVWRVGDGPFLHGLRMVSLPSLAAALAITFVTTVCSAWRWSTIAHNLGVPVALPGAVAAYYRSQFLNTVLPGGVLGDVHRGIRHGQHVGRVAPAVRVVAWDRVVGQLVQVLMALLILAVTPSPAQRFMPAVIVGAGTAAIGVAVALRARSSATTRTGRVLGTVRRDVYVGLLHQGSALRLVGTSVVGVSGHLTAFVIAARTAGLTVSIGRVIPVAVVILCATSLPTNVGGWGPREAAAAWSFGWFGVTATDGVAAATVYGLMVAVATLPGAVVLVAGQWQHRTRVQTAPSSPLEATGDEKEPVLIGASTSGAASE